MIFFFLLFIQEGGPWKYFDHQKGALNYKWMRTPGLKWSLSNLLVVYSEKSLNITI